MSASGLRHPLQPMPIPQPQAAPAASSSPPSQPSKLQRGENVAPGLENARSSVVKIPGGAGSDTPPLAPPPSAVKPVPSAQPQPAVLDNMWSRASAAAAAIKKEEGENGGSGNKMMSRIARVDTKPGSRACLIPDMPGRSCTADMAPPVRTAFEMLQEARPVSVLLPSRCALERSSLL